MATTTQQSEQAEAKRMADDKQRLQQGREQRAKQMQEHEQKRGRPTPTQEEVDLAKLGYPVEPEPDGSPEDPNVGFTQKQLQGERAQGAPYTTRQATAQSHQGGGSHETPATQPHRPAPQRPPEK